MALDHVVIVRVPFESARQAEIAQKTLLVDPVLKAHEINVQYETEESELVCTFAGISDRVIRVAISNAIDNIKTIVECMDEFDGKQGVVFLEEGYKMNG